MLISLRQTKPWVRLMSILGFISIGLMVIGGTINIFIFSRSNIGKSMIPVILMGVFNALVGLSYFFPSFFLFKFSSSIGRLLDEGGSNDMEEALSNQKSFWKFVGIMTVVGFSVAILGIAAAIIIPQLAKVSGK